MQKQLNLSGLEIPEQPEINHNYSSYQKFKIENAYKKNNDKDKQCGTCGNCFIKHYNGKNYYKCHHIGDSNGNGTDIRKSYVCNKWIHTPRECEYCLYWVYSEGRSGCGLTNNTKPCENWQKG